MAPKTGDVPGLELSSHVGDGGGADLPGEKVNVVEEPAYAQIAAELHAKILDYIRLFPREAQCVEVQPPADWRNPTCKSQLERRRRPTRGFGLPRAGPERESETVWRKSENS